VQPPAHSLTLARASRQTNKTERKKNGGRRNKTRQNVGEPATRKNGGNQKQRGLKIPVPVAKNYFFLAAFFLATFFFAFFFAAISVSFNVNFGIVCYGCFSAAPSIIRRTLRNLPLHSADEHANNHMLHQRINAWWTDFIPQYKKKATTLLTFFWENVSGCVFRTTTKSNLKHRTALQHGCARRTDAHVLQCARRRITATAIHSQTVRVRIRACESHARARHRP
jgi:hypothetical protein